jgi:hypothetical protein
MIRKFFRPGLSILALAACALPSSADELVLAGASKGVNANYSFAGAVLPVFQSRVGSGPAVRIWGDYLEYNYVGGVGKVEATGWGGAIAGVYQFSGNWGWANLSAGINYRNTVLSVNDPGNTQRGAHDYFVAQTDGGFNLDDNWRVTGQGSYMPATHDYFAQAGLDRSVVPDVRLGLNATFQGDKNYHQDSIGILAHFQVVPQLELAPSAGFSKSGSASGAYGGITLVLVAD